MALDASKLPYMEVQIQLQILEHIAQKGPLCDADLAFERQLEARDHEIVQAKLSQKFDAAPRSKDGADNAEAWKKAAEFTEFRKTADGLAHRHLQNDAKLADKQQQDIKRFGQFAELEAIQAGERKLHARHYDEERGPLRP